MAKRFVHVIVNPASGQPKPILHTLNNVFRKTGVDWELFLTKKSGDAKMFTRQALENGVDAVAAFGGDGTIMETAKGLIGKDTPLAILPGGTANLLSVELGIPKDLEKAAMIVANPDSKHRNVDMGKVNDELFILRVGLGFPAQRVELADRELKDKYGIMAYSIAGIKALKDIKPSLYHLEMDGKIEEIRAVACMVDNAGNMGMHNFTHGKEIRVDDGILDVILVRNPSLFETMLKSLPVTIKNDVFSRFQARKIRIQSEPGLSVNIDGEVGFTTPLEIDVIEGAVKILVPDQPSTGN